MRKIASIFIVLLLIAAMFAGCSPGMAPKNGDKTAGYAGTYRGSAPGYHGDIGVEVTLDEEGRILSIDIDRDHGETPEIGTVPIEKMPAAIVSSQSLDIDAISGATVTGDAILAAVADALASAGLDPATYGYERGETAKDKESYVLDIDSLPAKEPVTGSLVVEDVKGRKVALDLPISTYAVSTMDVVDFIIPLLGEDAFHRLVGSGQDGGGGLQGYARVYTPLVGDYMKHVGQISDHNAPFDLEMILAVDPDLLIVNSAMGAHRYALEIEPQLTAVGIPIVLIDVPGESFTTSVQDTLKLLGEIFQKEARASEVRSFIDDQYALLASKKLARRSDKPTVYYEKSGYSEIFGSTSSSQTGWGTVIAAAGGENIADPILLDTAAGKGGGNTLDPEYVLEADPDFIILSGSGAGWMDNFAGSTPSVPKFDILKRTGWNRLKAVQGDQVYELAHATSRSIFGFYAALKLAGIFYPDEFKGVDADAIMDEFFDRFMLVDSDITGWIYRSSEVLK